MGVRDIRAGNTQSRQNEGAFALVMLEIMMVAIAVGVFNNSWIWGGATFFLAMLLMSTAHASKAVPPLAAIAWGYIGYAIGGFFGSTNAAAMIGLLFAAISYGLHLQALEHFTDLQHEGIASSDPEPASSGTKVKARHEVSRAENSLRDIFSKDAPLSTSADSNYGHYISVSVFVFGLSVMLFWWWYEPDPTQDFDARSIETWSKLNEADREIYQILPDELRSHVNGLEDQDQAWYVREWDQRRKKTCPFGTAKTERSDEYYGLRRCLSKDERDTIDFAIEHVLSR